MKKIKYIFVCLLASMGVSNAQYQNFDLKTTNDDADTKSYIGRDYVRLQNGYSFSATKNGKTMNAKVQSGLTTEEAKALLAVANPTNSPTITPETLTAINTGAAVGQIPISSSVSPSGAKCYNVPIEIVPGRQGFQPNISLSYNSQAGNGVVGMGWNISGLSSIECVNMNIFFNGENDIPNPNFQGEYALDGLRLIKTKTQQIGMHDFIIDYETVQGNVKVTALVRIGIIQSFKVSYPNGTTANFGSVNGVCPTLYYPITSLTDINGNTITFSYDTTDNIDLNSGTTNELYYIKEINYGQCGSIPNFAKIKFSYDAIRPDQTFSLMSSKSCVLRKRLIRIESFANPGLIRTYQLAYSNNDPRILSNQNDVSRLTQISSFVNTGSLAADNLNPIKFYYGENISPSVKSSEVTFTNANFNLSQVYAIRGKFDTNSQNDALLVFPKKEAYTRLTNGTYTTNYLNNEQIKVYQNVKEGNSTPCLITLADGSETTFTTGDGFEDVFAANIDGKGQDEIVKVNTRFDDPQGSDWEYLTFYVYGVNGSKKLQLLNSYDYPLGELVYPNGTDYSVSPWKFYTGNFTGSGKTEVLALSKVNAIRNKALLIDLDGGGRNLFTQANLTNDSTELIYPMDIDGDGQTEIACVKADKTYLYKFVAGAGFQSVGTWALTICNFNEQYARQILFADLNGDGNIDIIRSPKAQEPKYITYPMRTAPSYFEAVDVRQHYEICPIKEGGCGYIQKCAYIDYYNLTKLPVCSKTIYDDGKGNIIDSHVSNPPSACQYPVLTSNTHAKTKCPGCGGSFEYDLKNWDYEHCFICGKTVWNVIGCLNHGFTEDFSGWRYQPARTLDPVPITHDDWIYQYTNGRSIVKTETLAGIGRANDHKYSIHEINGDETPDLIIQTANKHVIIYPFDIKNRNFKNEYLNYSSLSQGYELLDYDLNSSRYYSSLLALGSNKLVSLEFPFNHTRSNMISLMVNSMGVTDKTGYSQLTQGTNYTIGNSAIFPYTDFSGTFWVTTQTTSMYNKQVVGNASYSYGGAIMHNQGLGLLGFSSMVSKDLMTNKVVTSEFDPIHSGALTKQTTDEIESTFAYDYNIWINTKMKLLLTGKTVTDKLKGNTVTTSYSDFDEYGNAKNEVTTFSGDITNKQTIEYAWDNKVTGSIYLIGMPTNRKTTTVRGDITFIQNVGYEYFDEANKYRLQFIRNSIYKDTQTKILVSDIEYKYNADYGTLSDEIVHNKITNNSSDDLTTSYIYWDDDKCSLWKKTNPYGLTTKYNYKFDTRLLDYVTDYKENTVTYSYNGWRQKTGEISKSSSGTAFSTTTIDLNWNTTETEPKRLIKEIRTTTKQPAITTYVDAFGRETRKSTVGFDDKEVNADKAYDNFGRLKSTSAPYKQDESPLLITYGYDKYDRPIAVVQPNGSTTAYTYAGNEVTENKDGIITYKTTDATGKLVSNKDNGGEVKYTYRADGQPDKINTAGVETGFDYDDYGRQTKLIDPSAGTIQTAFDDTKHEVTQTWSSGKIITTVMNKYGQPATRTTPDFTSSYGYENGLPKSVTSTNGTSKVFTYDVYGRLGQVDETVNGKSYQEVYGYDDSRIGSVTYNTGSGTSLTKLASVVYKYKTNGYLYRLEDEMGNRFTETNSVNALGQEKSVLLGNGLTTTKNYTDEGLWTNVTTSNSSKTIQNMDYDFNRVNGTLNSRTDVAHDRLTESFSYDNLYRLKNFGTKSMDYSASGNILNKTDVGAYAYPNASKPYTLASVNTSSDLTNQLSIDHTVMSRATSIANATGLTATFTYNDDYDRASMQVKQGATETLNKTYFAGGKYEIETVSGVEKQRLYLDGSPYDASVLLEKTGANTQYYYLHRDYLGSITQITDNSANLAVEYSYDAWGRMRNPANWTPYTQNQLLQYSMPYGSRGYTGHEQLNGFGLINMNARLYDPLLGRFLAPDPLVTSPETSNGYNRYMYASDNPMMYVDLNGEYYDYPVTNSVGRDNRDGGNQVSNTNLVSNNSSSEFNNSYSGPNPGNQNNSGGNYNSGFNGNYGDYSGGEGYGAFVVGFMQWLFSPKLGPSSYKSNATNYTPSTYGKSKPVTLAKPVGSGASTVYAGGGSRRGVNGTNSGYSGNYIFAETYAHYQIGGGKPLIVNSSSLNFSFVSQQNLNKDGSVNLANPEIFGLNALSGTALALGSITLKSQGNNRYKIEPDIYDFDIRWKNGFTFRNFATFGAGLLHGPVIDNIPIPLIFNGGLPIFGPSVYTGSGKFTMYFEGSVYIKP